MSKALRVALCQMLVGSNKSANITKAVQMIGQAKAQGAQLVVLPECFNSPYGTAFFPEYAEKIEGGATTFDAMSRAATEHGLWIVAGSIPERTDAGQLYNTSMVFNPHGSLVATHRKMHLFRINTETVKFDESEVLSAGSAPTVVDMGNGLSFGVGICFDIRFPQLALAYTARDTSFLIYPGAFNMVTGPAHWELLARARAVDSQQYVLLCSPARDTTASYVAWGHSLAVDPWGTVVTEAAESEGLFLADLDFSKNSSTREKVPSLKGTRHDLYSMHWS